MKCSVQRLRNDSRSLATQPRASKQADLKEIIQSYNNGHPSPFSVKSEQPIQRCVFSCGRSLTLGEAAEKLGIPITDVHTYNLLRTHIDSSKNYTIEDMPRLLGIDRRIWKTVGSTRPPKSEVTGKIGHMDEGSTAPDMTVRTPHPDREEIGHVEGLSSSEDNLELEENIGSILLTSDYVKQMAKEIHEITAKYSTITDEDIRREAYKHKDTWGGAYGFMHGKTGVDEEVYATTQHAEKAIEDPSWKKDYPVENVLHKRLESPGFSFDAPIEKTSPDKWPPQLRVDCYKAHKAANPESKETRDEFIGRLQGMDSKSRQKELEKIHVRSSTSTNLSGETHSSLDIVSPRGPGYRQSNSGRQFNVITHEPYLREAEELKKPTLSGPSGTAFRFLKAYSLIRERNGDKGPSLEDARLVILANLLPPNGHHSYHEIMDGSVGVGGLSYFDCGGYGDLAKKMPVAVERAIALVLTNTSHRVRMQKY